MLKSEEDSGTNNESDDTLPLLRIGSDLQFSLANEATEFTCTPEDILWALTLPVSIFEELGLQYVSGHILGKVLKKFHADPQCKECQKFVGKITAETERFREQELFVWLKRYDDDSSTLFSPNELFTEYVKKVCQVTLFLMEKYLSHVKILSSINNNVFKYVTAPDFCTSKVQRECTAVIIRTLFFYKLNWLNSSMKDYKKPSERKLKILKNM